MLQKGVLYEKGELHQIQDYLDSVVFTAKGRGRRRRTYAELPCAYDIETSSFELNGDKVAITYSHAVDIGGYCFLMREWSDFQSFLIELANMMDLHLERRLIIYVHNLPYEFQFMKRQMAFEQVFCNGDARKSLYAFADLGFEFRDSWMLSGMKLEKVAENLTEHHIAKLKGDLDYSLIRTPRTPLTAPELGYIINDVLIIEYYIAEAMKICGSITKIPLTRTGYVREHCRDNTVRGPHKREYKALMRSLTLEVDEYIRARQTFAGGFTHASKHNSCKTLTNVRSLDFTSSYPAVMVEYKYPMGKGFKVYPRSKDEFYSYIDTYCCMFELQLYGMQCIANEPYLSGSKAESISGAVLNNGRVELADEATYWVTNVDFKCIEMSYEIDDFNVPEMWCYQPGYLPTELISCVLEYYCDKTTLKGIDGKLVEYNRAKENVNSIYGMTVMDIIRESFEWHDQQKQALPEPQDIPELVQKNNSNSDRFLFYPWGLFITAYARYNLFSEIVKLGDDYVYSDTDSIKLLNYDKHADVFEASNARIIDLLETACEHHGFDKSIIHPKDKDGGVHTLGIWDDEGEYKQFKTLGAKRYMVEELNKETQEWEINITVSGVKKTDAVPYLIDTYGEDGIFDAFTDGLTVPPGYCGKMVHTYIDETKVGHIRDYTGLEYDFKELSGVHLADGKYDLSISSEYQEFLESLGTR